MAQLLCSLCGSCLSRRLTCNGLMSPTQIPSTVPMMLPLTTLQLCTTNHTITHQQSAPIGPIGNRSYSTQNICTDRLRVAPESSYDSYALYDHCLAWIYSLTACTGTMGCRRGSLSQTQHSTRRRKASVYSIYTQPLALCGPVRIYTDTHLAHCRPDPRPHAATGGACVAAVASDRFCVPPPVLAVRHQHRVRDSKKQENPAWNDPQ